MERRAVVLLSGGLDSTTVLAMARDQGFECYTMAFDYGQRHRLELEAAATIAARSRVRAHQVVEIDLRVFGGSALTDDAIEVPKDRKESEMGAGIPSTYVPARNTIFLSFALAWADVLGAEDICIGVNVLDYSGYPDCRPEYIKAYEKMANLGTRGVVRIQAPLIRLQKSEIINIGRGLGVDYSTTVSCYDVTKEGACGKCDACQLRRRGFLMAGFTDPTKYV